MRMAGRTIAAQITALETERTRLETAIAAAQSGHSSFTVGGFSATRWRVQDLRSELIRVEKSLQRLYRGGRGFQIDLSYAAGDQGTADYPATT